MIRQNVNAPKSPKRPPISTGLMRIVCMYSFWQVSLSTAGKDSSNELGAGVLKV